MEGSLLPLLLQQDHSLLSTSKENKVKNEHKMQLSVFAAVKLKRNMVDLRETKSPVQAWGLNDLN